MKIIIDNSNLIVGGGIQVATSFLNDINNHNLSDEFIVIQSYNSAQDIDKKVFKNNFTFFDLSEEQTTSKVNRIRKVKEIENETQPNVIFTVFGPSYHKSNFPKIVGFAIPYLIYPDSPFFNQISFVENLKYKLLSILKKRAFIKNSDALIFETDNAKEVFSKFIPKTLKTFTVSNTINEVFLDEEKWKVSSLKEDSFFNILCLSAFYPHKNLTIIPHVIDFLINVLKMDNFKFNITISSSDLQLIEQHKKYVNFLGKVPLNQIPDLYKKSDVIFIPTLLEVFSATYLEAMFMKKPIIASDMPFSRDICYNAALYCDPLNASDYAKKILMLYNDNELYKKLVEKGTENLKRFGNSMDRTKKYLEILKKHAHADNKE